MLKRAVLATILAALPAAAYAQGAVIQAGPVAPGHVALWGGNGSIRDGGSQVPPGVLPKATTSALGAIIVGSGLGVATSGNLSVTYGKAGTTALQGSLYGTANGVATLDGSGLLPAVQLPLPGVSSLGGAQALTAPTHQFLTGLGTNGVFTTGQPAIGDISGVGSMATQNASGVAITGGTLNGVTIGATTPGTGAFTGLGVSGAVSLTGAGTALSVTNNASVGGFATVSNGLNIGSNTFNGVIGNLNGVAAAGRQFRWQTAGVARVYLGMSTDAESGSNKGANLCTLMRDDSGNALSWTDCFTRATGGLNLTQGVTYAGDTAVTSNNTAIFSNQTFSGSGNDTSDNGMNFNRFIISDNVANSVNTQFKNADTGWQVVQTTGSAATGGRIGLSYVLAQGAAQADSGTDQFFQANEFLFRTPFSQGGTAPTIGAAKGRGFGANNVVHLQSGATNWFEASAQENDCSLDIGSSAAIRNCLALADPSGGVQGAVVDNAIWIYGAGAQFKAGIEFAGSQGWDQDPNGALLLATLGSGYASRPSTVKWGLDVLQATFPSTGNPYDGGLFQTNGASLDGVGTLRLGTTYFTSSATGIAIDAKGAVGNTANGAGAIASGGTGYINGTNSDLAFDPYGGIYELTVSAGVVTSITVYRQPVFSSTTTPTNPVSTTSWAKGGSGGSGLTLNLSWDTTSNQVSLNPTGGTILMAGLPSSAPATHCALWVNSGVVTRTTCP